MFLALRRVSTARGRGGGRAGLVELAHARAALLAVGAEAPGAQVAAVPDFGGVFL